ncbi:LysR family transcriptional regulator [Synergistales bacterium]|nr:LysR family transcriptional regulator [Synergistales bacterium]GHV50077.1 LysR family transcriptional regulator [Synergistales bacterium]
MSIAKYEAFLQTVECGNLTKAAEKLGYTQSSMSHILNTLESELGVELLVRDRCGARLTSDGVSLLPLIKDVCDAQKKLISGIGELKGLQSGLIRIGTLISVSVHWLPNILNAFNKDYPDVNFDLLRGNYQEIENWVIEGRIDCGFIRLPSKTGLQSIFLEEDPLIVILPLGHPLANCERYPVDRLEKDNLIILRDNLDIEVMDFLSNNRISAKNCITVDDDYTIISMVESGLGISILPERVLYRTPYRIVKKMPDKPHYRKIGLALKSIEHASTAAKRFIDYLGYRNAPNFSAQ